MTNEARSGSPFQPKRWFLGDDDLVRPFWRAVFFLMLAFVLLTLVSGALRGTGLRPPPGLRILLGSLLASAGLLLESWFLLALLDRRSFRSLGLWPYRGWSREFLLGAALGAVLILCVVGTLAATRTITQWTAAPNLLQSLGGFSAVAGTLLVAASFEEILFRGYAFQRLVDSIGRIGAIAIFSGFFGAVHLNNPGATPLSTANTVLAGILLAVAYLKTRALWLPIGLHWAWNFLMGAVLGLPVSGFPIAPSLLIAESSGPAWWSGGAYGPEGGLVLTVFCTGAIVWLARTRKISPSPAMEDVLR